MKTDSQAFDPVQPGEWLTNSTSRTGVLTIYYTSSPLPTAAISALTPPFYEHYLLRLRTPIPDACALIDDFRALTINSEIPDRYKFILVCYLHEGREMSLLRLKGTQVGYVYDWDLNLRYVGSLSAGG